MDTMKNMNFICKLPIPQETKKKYPVSEEAIAKKVKRDEEIKKIFTGESDKMVLVIGPCSADAEEPVMEYVHRLARVQEQVKVPPFWNSRPTVAAVTHATMLAAIVPRMRKITTSTSTTP